MISKSEFDAIQPGDSVRIVDQWADNEIYAAADIDPPDPDMDPFLGMTMQVAGTCYLGSDTIPDGCLRLEGTPGNSSWYRFEIACVIPRSK